jgi:hypothetical protein
MKHPKKCTLFFLFFLFCLPFPALSSQQLSPKILFQNKTLNFFSPLKAPLTAAGENKVTPASFKGCKAGKPFQANNLISKRSNKLPVSAVSSFLEISPLAFDASGSLAGGSISGTVTDYTSALGITGIYVTVFETNNNVITNTVTGIDGTYTAGGLPDGSYKVYFDGRYAGYINEWYNDKADFNSADPIWLTAPSNTVTGIDAALDIGVSISGKVTDSTEQGIAGVYVNIYDQNYNFVSNGYTDRDGNYIAGGLPEGGYKVWFQGVYAGYINEWYNDKTDFNTADLIWLTVNNTTVNAVMDEGASISGRVTDSATGAGIADVYVEIRDTNNNYVSYGYTDIDGNYTAGGLPGGSYKVWFRGVNAGYINEWYNNKGSSCDADAVEVTAPNTKAGIDAVLVKGGSIAGRITDGTGQGIPNVYVNIYDTNYNNVSSASTDEDGNYTAGGLPSGGYKVYFSDGANHYVSEWYDNKKDFCEANLVLVAAPASTSINAVLDRAGSITGKVTDSNQQGIADVFVGIAADEETFNPITTTYTDFDGSYAAVGLPSGSYKVYFGGSGAGYLDEWYNNKADFESADGVLVTAPDATTGIDAILGGDDHGDTCSEATGLSINSSINGVIEQTEDADYFQVEVSETGLLTLYTSGNMLYTTGELRDESCNVIAQNDGYNNFYISQLVSAGTYYIAVTGYYQTTGNYTLNVEFSNSWCEGVSPSFGLQGETLDVTITGYNTNFEYSTIVDFGCSGITINSTSLSSETQIIANITIAPDASPDICDVTAATGDEIITCRNAFAVRGGGSISGTVIDDTGAGVPNVLVAALDPNFYYEFDAYTDGLGNYTRTELPAGGYKVIFYTLYAGLPLASEWYDDKGSFETADLVWLTTPSNTDRD